MPSPEEKNIFLKSLENEAVTEALEKQQNNDNSNTPAPKKGMSGTGLFASVFIFFLFLIVLLIFVLSVSGEESPILQSFGVEGYEVKDFLTNVVNKTFMTLSILLLLLFSIGIFRGFSLPKESASSRRNSFIFGLVCGGLIFLVILSWIGSFAFIDRFAVASGNVRAKIEVTNIEPDEEIIAPLDIHFSAKNIVKSLESLRKYPESFQWSKDSGQTFTTAGLDDEITFAFETKGKKEVMLKIILENGNEELFSLPFTVDDATFSTSPAFGSAPFTTTLSAEALVKGKSPKTFEWNMDNDASYELQKNTARLPYTFEYPGEYPIALRIVFHDDSVQTFYKTISVDTPEGKPISSVINTEPETSGDAPFTVYFSAENSFTKEGKIIAYEWTIGDKKIKKEGISIQHTFEEEGIHPVTLQVINDIKKTDSTSTEIEVLNASHPPSARITTIPKTSSSNTVMGTTPFHIVLDASSSQDKDNDIVKYEWFLDEENIPFATGDKTEYTFRDQGEFTVRLKVTDAEQNISEENISITTSLPDISVQIEADPENGSVPLIVNFDGSQSSCRIEDCKIISFEWDFGDGSPVQITGAHTSHQFTKVGTYTASLTTTTNTGETAKNTVQIAVVQPPFVACFEPSRSSGTSPLSVTFNPSECSQGKIERYKWDFGDGVISNQRKPTHTFDKPGKYTVTLTIFNENNSVSTDTKVITVE